MLNFHFATSLPVVGEHTKNVGMKTSHIVDYHDDVKEVSQLSVPTKSKPLTANKKFIGNEGG